MQIISVVIVIGLAVLGLVLGLAVLCHVVLGTNLNEFYDLTASPFKYNQSIEITFSTSQTPIPLTAPTVSSEVNCHIYMSNAQASVDEKSCRVKSTLESCGMLLEKYASNKSINCCKAASKCNQEAYCGQGQMMCLGRTGMERAECVCNRGWQGPRCEICIPKVKVPCWCSLTNHQDIKHISGMACSSSDAVPTRRCWIHHLINGKNHTCDCHQASDGMASIPETRCSEDKMHLCGD